MKIWLVGTGYWGSKIQRALDCAGVTSKTIDIKQGQSINDIDSKDPVILATPLWQHFDQTMQLLDRGHDLYVEKPLATTVKEIAQIQSAIRGDQLVMVGHIFQHHPQNQEIHNAISCNTIGKLLHISSQRLNWGIYQTKTDPLLSLATHDISIIDDFCHGDIEINYAQGYHFSDNLQFDRVTFGGHVNDVSFDVDVSWCWPSRIRQTIFIGSDAQIIWNQDNNTVIVTKHKILNHRAINDQDPKISLYSSEKTPLDYEIQHWIDCINNRCTPKTGVKQAMSVAKVIEQVQRLL